MRGLGRDRSTRRADSSIDAVTRNATIPLSFSSIFPHPPISDAYSPTFLKPGERLRAANASPDGSPGVTESVLRIVVRPDTSDDDSIWTAECLEFDLVGIGKTPIEALEALHYVVRARRAFARHHAISNPFHAIPAAPLATWNAYAVANEIAELFAVDEIADVRLSSGEKGFRAILRA